MSAASPSQIGDFLFPVKKRFGIASAVSASQEGELYFLSGIYADFSEKVDPGWILATRDLVFEYGITGLVTKISVKRGHTLETVVERNRQNDFIVGSGILDSDASKVPLQYQRTSPNETLEGLLDVGYGITRRMTDTRERVIGNLFDPRSGRSVLTELARKRGDVSYRDIIPDFTDDKTVVKVSDGCAFNCYFCPEGGGLRLLNIDEIQSRMWATRKIQVEHHTAGARKYMIEGFINSSDILWFEVMKSTPKVSNATPIDIARMYLQTFPEVKRLSAFFGVRNTIRVHQQDPDYFRKLADEGIVRAYIGIETAHTEGSRLLGKNETYEMKKEAMEILRDARIGVKAIVQVGTFGQGFYRRPVDKIYGVKEPHFTPVTKIHNATARLIGEVLPYRVIFSEYIPLAATPWLNHPNRALVEGTGNPLGETKYILRQIGRYKNPFRNWQGQGVDGMTPFEIDYQQVVEGKRRAA